MSAPIESADNKRPITRIELETPPNGIRGMRLLFNLSAAELARKIGVAPSHITRGETRGVGIGPENWRKLAEFFGVQPWELHDPFLAEKKSQLFAETHNKSVAS